MEYTLNQIIDYFAKSSIEYVNIFTNSLQPKGRDGNRCTAPEMSGMIVPLSGRAIFALNGTAYKMEEGSILHAGSKMELEILTEGDKPWEYAVIHYRTLKEAQLDLKNCHFQIKVKRMERIRENVFQLIKSGAEPGSMAALSGKTVFFSFLQETLLQAKRHLEEKDSPSISKALAYIQEHYAEDFSVAELADRLQMERRRFSELFEQHTGLTPVQYITEYRLRIARELLRIGDRPISEVAVMVGYQDPFYFSRVFKKHEGISPSEYRKHMGGTFSLV